MSSLLVVAMKLPTAAVRSCVVAGGGVEAQGQFDCSNGRLHLPAPRAGLDRQIQADSVDRKC